jgi:hypothetical protein
VLDSVKLGVASPAVDEAADAGGATENNNAAHVTSATRLRFISSPPDLLKLLDELRHMYVTNRIGNGIG